MKTTTRTLVLVAALAAFFVAGRWTVGLDGAAAEPTGEPGPAVGVDTETELDAAATEPSLWTCPMHPQIKLPDPGDCPICGMDLVRLTSGADEDPRQLVMSPASRELARIVAAPARRKNLTRPVRMVGKIDYDETAVRTISAWVPGRLDRLYVDYTGVAVAAGDHLVRLYSPDLLSAQEELLSARDRGPATAGEASDFLTESNRRAYEAARGKLLLLGLTEAQVQAVEDRGTAEDHVMLTSPSSGVVIQKFLDEGAYVQTGTPVYRIADLDRLWVRLDAYEQDLAWLRPGQPVELEVEALPGERFEGRVSFIDPFIHEHTRTAKVRVNIANAGGRLKPGMFVRGVALARIGAGGRVLDRYLAGKWVSPMHPEIVKDGPGVCDICGMDLVPAEDLGLVGAVGAVASEAERPIVLPSSAVLVTGKRAVVYVEVPGTERPTYEGREVVLGPRAGDEYVVLAGLQEGERVVVNGAFRIDSSMQILAKPSMMDMPGDAAVPEGPGALVFRASLQPLVEGYLALQVALAADDEGAARGALDTIGASFSPPVGSALPARARALWIEEQAAIEVGLERAARAEDLDELRAAFEGLSTAMLALVRELGHAGPVVLREAYCPMAFEGRGGAWLQAGEAIANPYFGAEMLRCGEIRAAFLPVGPAGAADVAPESGEDHPGHDPALHEAPAAEAATPFAALFQRYLELQQRLAADDEIGARQRAEELLDAVLSLTEEDGVDPGLLERLHRMHSALMGADAGAGIEALRAAFRAVSVELLAIEAAARNPLAVDLRVVHCPMAFDGDGADWIQAEETVANPYYGASMLRCGTVERVLPGN